jgi:hypothetical protein
VHQIEDNKKKIQQDYGQLLIFKIEHTMNDIFLDIGSVVIGDLQDCIQLGVH